MKRYYIFILLWGALIWSGWQATQSVACPVADAGQQEKKAELSHRGSEIISALLSANSVADISLQQEQPVQMNTGFRRHLPSRLLPEKIYVLKKLCDSRLLPPLYQFVQRSFRAYAASQKQCGYYLYTLRKIVI